jgi:glucokinase
MAEFEFPILVGDIGGTNARFAWQGSKHSAPIIFETLQTADYATFNNALKTAILPQCSMPPKTLILAVAAPILGDVITLTNCNWVVNSVELKTYFSFNFVVLMNDFVAQGLAVATLERAHFIQIGGGEIKHHGNRVILGPGTGLGVSALIHTGLGWQPISGEGGHVDFGPQTQRDYLIFPHLAKTNGRISGEQILCGRGMVNLYNAICLADGTQPIYNAPKQITDAALSKIDEIAQETLELFASYLARLAGDLALTFMAEGGVYLSGGIALKIAPFLQNPAVRAAFENKSPHSDRIKTIPLFIVTHPLAAIVGLCGLAGNPQDFNID